MAVFSLLDIRKLLASMERLREIKEARLDGKPLEIASARIVVSAQGIRIEGDFRDDGTPVTLRAEHDWTGGTDEIQVNGADVDKDDVDLKLHSSLFHVQMEYRVQYASGGAQHALILRAKHAGL